MDRLQLAYFIAKSVFVPYQEYSLALGLFVTGEPIIDWVWGEYGSHFDWVMFLRVKTTNWC